QGLCHAAAQDTEPIAEVLDVGTDRLRRVLPHPPEKLVAIPREGFVKAPPRRPPAPPPAGESHDSEAVDAVAQYPTGRPGPSGQAEGTCRQRWWATCWQNARGSRHVHLVTLVVSHRSSTPSA